ncbi:MAG: cation diffusion facilitator family transporter [Myxococcota bacterium]
MLGNGVITVAKFVASAVSGSGALRAEAVHSLVDTLNQGFLWIGDRRAARSPSRRFQYGYGAEANFWGLLAAIGVLLFGGVQTIQHGIHAFEHPEVPGQPIWVFSVLGFAVAVELWVLVSVLRGLAKTRGQVSWSDHISRQGPGTVAVLLEDTAAVVGSVLAAAAVATAIITQDGRWDAACQVLIGVMLTLVGFILILRNHRSLLGEAIRPEKQRELHAFLEDLPAVDRVTALKTRQLTTHAFRMKAEVVFSGGELASRLMESYAMKVTAAAERHDAASVLGNFADELFIEQARHVDEIEKRVRERFPGARYIDLEPHLREHFD